MSLIKEFFQNQTVFITGGSGFLGKLFIEKLLRECDIQKIYVLMRPKKNKSPEERFSELFNYPCFDAVKAENPDALQKVSLINGDCQQADLGLNESDVKILLEETTCVIHAAANVKFDQTLKEASYNVRATKDILELAKNMKNLKTFIYISTAYSNCVRSSIEEEFYEPPLKLEELLTLVGAVDDDTLKTITPALLNDWPNTYNYTKCVSEDVVKTAGEVLPLVVVRPAIITSTASEPVKGWIDNLYGPVGISCGAGLGILRTFHGKTEVKAQLVPADYVINLTLAAAWYRQQSSTTRIYNFVGHEKNEMTWGQYIDTLKSMDYKVASIKAIWYPFFNFRENKTWNGICAFFLHTLAAYLIDSVLFCLRKPRMAVKLYGRLHEQLGLISYFTTRNWQFATSNVTELWGDLNDEDKKLFCFDMESLNWGDYIYEFLVGARLYIVKESMGTLPRAQMKHKFLKVAHYLVVGLFWWLVYKAFRLIFGFFL